MKLVKFDNGKYGIRRHWFFGWYFQDLTDSKYYWLRDEGLFMSCQGAEEPVRKILAELKSKNKYTIIKDK